MIDVLILPADIKNMNIRNLKIRKKHKRIALFSLAVFLLIGTFFLNRTSLFIVIDVHQNFEIIDDTVFGEPPQFAVWLEDAKTHEVKTIFVTYRSATGDWLGKAECEVALPYWFDIYKKEMNTDSLPRPSSPAPAAITGATPKKEHFQIRSPIKKTKKWILWLEMNLAGDFNKHYTYYDNVNDVIDDHYVGQPALIYRGEITSKPGEEIKLELFGLSVLGDGKEKIETDTTTITTAKNIFKEINVKIVTDK